MSIKLSKVAYNRRDEWPTIAEIGGLDSPKYTFNMCSCSEISKGIIHVIKKDTFEKYKTKIDKDGNEYFTLNLSELENETVEDFKSILKYYDVNQFTSIMNKSLFDKYFKKIKLN